MSDIYASNRINATWNGIKVTEGLGPEDFLTIEPLDVAKTPSFGCDGKMTTSINANKGATITLTVMQGSKVNRKIGAIDAAETLIGGTTNFSVFTVTDSANDLNVFYILNKVVLTERPSVTFGATAGTVQWKWVAEVYVTTDDPSTITSQISNFFS